MHRCTSTHYCTLSNTLVLKAPVYMKRLQCSAIFTVVMPPIGNDRVNVWLCKVCLAHGWCDVIAGFVGARSINALVYACVYVMYMYCNSVLILY